MIGLWRKDLPWMMVLGLGGAVSIGLTMCDGGDLFGMFVVGTRDLDAVVVLSVVFGLAVGVVGATWDVLLGTREYLAQRPVTHGAFAAARIGAVGITTASFVVLGPVVGRVVCNRWSNESVFDHWALVPELIAECSVALPAAAAGLAATTLPVRPIVRLLMFVGMPLVIGCAIDLSGSSLDSAVWRRALVYLVTAVALFAVASVGMRSRWDPDRSWTPRLRAGFGSAVLLIVALVGSVAVVEYEFAWLRDVQREYPRVAAKDGRALLVVQHESDERRAVWHVVDAEHQPTGEVISREHLDEVLDRAWPGRTIKLEFDPPRQGGHWRRAGGSLGHTRGGVLYRYDYGERRAIRLRFSEEQERMPAGWSMDVVEDLRRERTVPLLGDPKSGALRRLDPATNAFVVDGLPDGDVFAGFGQELRKRLEGFPTELALEPDRSTRYVRGREGSYVLLDGRWHPVASSRVDDTPRWRAKLDYTGDDPLEFSLETTPGLDLPEFRHAYAPRTGAEHLLAAMAMAVSTLRLPALQVVDHVLGDEGLPASPWHDPLTTDGKRSGLLVLQLAVAACCVWLVRRRLRRIGAGAQAVRFWTVATALTGASGLLVAWLCEPKRAHARPELPEPVRPRIFTATPAAAPGRDQDSEEVSA